MALRSLASEAGKSLDHEMVLCIYTLITMKVLGDLGLEFSYNLHGMDFKGNQQESHRF